MLGFFWSTSLAVWAFQVICSVCRTTRLVGTCNLVARIIESKIASKSSDTYDEKQSTFHIKSPHESWEATLQLPIGDQGRRWRLQARGKSVSAKTTVLATLSISCTSTTFRSSARIGASPFQHKRSECIHQASVRDAGKKEDTGCSYRLKRTQTVKPQSWSTIWPKPSNRSGP